MVVRTANFLAFNSVAVLFSSIWDQSRLKLSNPSHDMYLLSQRWYPSTILWGIVESASSTVYIWIPCFVRSLLYYWGYRNKGSGTSSTKNSDQKQMRKCYSQQWWVQFNSDSTDFVGRFVTMGDMGPPLYPRSETAVQAVCIGLRKWSCWLPWEKQNIYRGLLLQPSWPAGYQNSREETWLQEQKIR